MRPILLIATLFAPLATAAVAQSDDREAILMEKWQVRAALTQPDVELMVVAHPAIQAKIAEIDIPETDEITAIINQGTSDMVPSSAVGDAVADTEFMPMLDAAAAEQGYTDYMAYADKADHLRQVAFSQWMVTYSHSLNFDGANDPQIPDLAAFLADDAQPRDERIKLAEQLNEMYAKFAIRPEDAAVYDTNLAALKPLFSQ